MVKTLTSVFLIATVCCLAFFSEVSRAEPGWIYSASGPVAKKPRTMYAVGAASDGGGEDNLQSANSERLLQIYRGLHGLPRVGRSQLKTVNPDRLRKLLKSVGGLPRKRYFDPYLDQYNEGLDEE